MLPTSYCREFLLICETMDKFLITMGTRGKFTPNQTIFCSLEILNPNKRIIIHLWLLYIKIHNLFHCYTSPTDMMFKCFFVLQWIHAIWWSRRMYWLGIGGIICTGCIHHMKIDLCRNIFIFSFIYQTE